MLFRRKDRGEGGAAVAEPNEVGETRRSVDSEFTGPTDELHAEIRALTEANRGRRDANTESRLLTLRHIAGIRMLEESGPTPGHPEPDFDALPPAEGLPDIAPDQLSPELLRAGILRDGSALVRGMVPRERALSFAELIDRSYAARVADEENRKREPGFYEEFVGDERFGAPLARPWVKVGGGVLAVDSPALAFAMLEIFESSGINRLARDYLGEPVGISGQKTTLRKAEPDVAGAWHQDGAFMGDVRALNVWISLSRCGDAAPGLDIVPRRLDNLVTAGTDGAMLEIQVSQEKAEEAAGDTPIVRPIFEPGDVIFFDELCLHQTGSDPAMPNPRYAIESWFFGASAFPDGYAPIAV
jgi:hypothetical protein